MSMVRQRRSRAHHTLQQRISEEYGTIKEAAFAWSVPERTVSRWCQYNYIVAVKVGDVWLVKKPFDKNVPKGKRKLVRWVEGI